MPSEQEANASYARALAERQRKRFQGKNKRLVAKGETPMRAIAAGPRESDAELQGRLGEWGDVSVGSRAQFRRQSAERLALKTQRNIDVRRNRDGQGQEPDWAFAARVNRIEAHWEELGLGIDEMAAIDDLDEEILADEASYENSDDPATAVIRYR